MTMILAPFRSMMLLLHMRLLSSAARRLNAPLVFRKCTSSSPLCPAVLNLRPLHRPLPRRPPAAMWLPPAALNRHPHPHPCRLSHGSLQLLSTDTHSSPPPSRPPMALPGCPLPTLFPRRLCSVAPSPSARHASLHLPHRLHISPRRLCRLCLLPLSSGPRFSCPLLALGRGPPFFLYGVWRFPFSRPSRSRSSFSSSLGPLSSCSGLFPSGPSVSVSVSAPALALGARLLAPLPLLGFSRRRLLAPLR